MHYALIIDDHGDTLDALKKVLESMGYSVRTSNNLYGGLDVLKNQPVEFVLLDYNMPGMGVNAFLREAEARQKGVPIILMSVLPDLGERAERLSMKTFLAKPFTTGQLLNALRLVGVPAPPIQRAPADLPKLEMFLENRAALQIRTKP